MKARNLTVELSLSQLAKMLCLIIACFYSSTELEKSTEQVLPGSEVGGEERVEAGAGGRNDPNNVCTCK
jgi:hypothetical protein